MKFYNMECPICKSEKVKEKFKSKDINLRITKETFTLYECDKCEAVFIMPQMSEKKLHSFYPKNYSPHEFNREIVKRNDKNIFTLFKKYNKDSNFSLIDLGCGGGSFLFSVKHYFPNSTVMGVDFSKYAIDELKKNKIEGVKSSLYDLNLGKKFDVIIAFSILEHLTYPHKFINTINNLSHKGTIILIHVPDINSYTAKKFGKNWVHWDCPRHQINYSEKTLGHLFKDFKKDRIFYGGSFGITASSILLTWERSLNSDNLLNNLVYKIGAVFQIFFSFHLGKYTKGDMLWVGKRI